jgi:hypothetical protein
MLVKRTFNIFRLELDVFVDVYYEFRQLNPLLGAVNMAVSYRDV